MFFEGGIELPVFFSQCMEVRESYCRAGRRGLSTVLGGGWLGKIKCRRCCESFQVPLLKATGLTARVLPMWFRPDKELRGTGAEGDIYRSPHANRTRPLYIYTVS